MTFNLDESEAILSRLRQNGRLPDHDFSEMEQLYRRFCHEELVDNQFISATIKPPGSSVNRQRYSEPNDVLFPDNLCCGIAYFTVQDITSIRVMSGNSKDFFDFGVSHEPLPENYAHSEITVSKNGELFSKKFSKMALKEFQNILRNKISILSISNIDMCPKELS